MPIVFNYVIMLIFVHASCKWQIITKFFLNLFQTRVFVTHGLSYLPQCDVIVTIESGRISEMGAYAELIDNNGAFAEFVHTYTAMEDSDEEMDACKLIKELETRFQLEALMADDLTTLSTSLSILISLAPCGPL